MLLKDKTVLVVGASTGMGRRTAIYAGEQGAKLIVAARRKDECDKIIDAHKAAGGDGLALHMDGTDEASVNDGIAQVAETYGTLDCVFNNIGNTQGFGPFIETPLERWQASMDVNVTSVFMLMRAQIPLMQKNGGGVIVNNSSTAGLQGVPTMADYCASKWGLIGLTYTVAKEYGPENIRCLAIAPGVIMTERAQEMESKMPQIFDNIRKDIPLGHTGDMQDIAELVCWLMSDKAKYVTGITVPIDGGRTA
ncbi:MAG: SDR family NAD(P)-dependent oxidoreductase [Pseudomonadota bacterium]